MTDAAAADLVSHIVGDIAAHAAFRPFDGAFGESLADAYAMQDRVAEELVARGIRQSICGYKIALNSPHLMAHFGVSEPVSGPLFSDQNHPSPAVLNVADYRTLVIEPEIAAVIGRRIDAPVGGRDGVAPAIARFIPAFELIDTRDAHIPDIKLMSAIAQNITNEGLVTGGPGVPPGELDVDSLTVTVSFDDETIATMTGAAPQHPLDAVAWLADHLTARGKALEPGMIVLCGTHMPPEPVGAARQVRADFGPVGAARFTLR
jgi:2-keto-4-pentenoate hydratase